MGSNQQMDVCLDHPDLKNVCSLLAGHASQETTQELSHSGVNEVLPFAGSPGDVIVQAVPHRQNMPER